MSRAVCLSRNNFGQFCEKEYGHTGNHHARVFSVTDAQRAWQRKKHVGDERWVWVGNGWQTKDPQLVAEALARLEASRT